MSKLNVTSPTYEEVVECTESREGQELLYEMGLRTPEVDTVPWVAIDDVSSKQGAIYLASVTYPDPTNPKKINQISFSIYACSSAVQKE